MLELPNYYCNIQQVPEILALTLIIDQNGIVEDDASLSENVLRTQQRYFGPVKEESQLRAQWIALLLSFSAITHHHLAEDWKKLSMCNTLPAAVKHLIERLDEDCVGDVGEE
jgi:hypothetical protein